MARSRTCEVIRHLCRASLRDGTELTDGQLLECYLSQGDESAFAALVQRHAPMVWGVCRRVLANHHDAEDAFQAAFLVLVRKAASIVPREMVPNFLYGVAHQTALKARAMAAQRKARERQLTPMPEPAVVVRDGSGDLQSLLDQELCRLPDKYRVAIVLCDLEEKTRKEAARQLGCPEGTLAARLSRGRVMLAKRLVRRGVVLSGGLLAAALAQAAASGCVPPSVVSSTIEAASLFAAGQAAAGLISARVVALTEGVLKTMLLSKLKMALAVGLLVVVVILGIGVGVLRTPAADPILPPAKAGAPADSKQEAKVKWEYKAIGSSGLEKLAPEGSKDKFIEGLNTLGDQGWELVTVQTGTSVTGSTGTGGFSGPGPGGGTGGSSGTSGSTPNVYLFKRPK